MFSAIRNNIGYQNVASLMRQRGIRNDWRHWHGRGASMVASGGSTAELSPLTDDAKMVGRGEILAQRERSPLPNAPARPIRAYSRVQRNHQTTHLQDWHTLLVGSTILHVLRGPSSTAELLCKNCISNSILTELNVLCFYSNHTIQVSQQWTN